MHIQLSPLSWLNAILPGRREAAADVPATSPPATAEIDSDSDASSGPLREILSGYDVRHITPREYSELLDKLEKAGQLKDDELRDLTAIRSKLDQARVDPDAPIDLIELLSENLSELQSGAADLGECGDDPTLATADAVKTTLRQLSWLSKFSQLHRGVDDQPIDAVV